MLDNIGTNYVTITSALGIIFGSLLIIYRNRFLKGLKRHLSKQDDSLSEEMLDSWESKSEISSQVIIVIVGLFFIIMSILQLLQ